MSAQALAWADLSTFTSFVALDCLLPGPQEWHAFIKLFARTIALPLLLLLASALMWTTCWLFRHLALRLHRKYGHRHNLRWQPLRQMQRHARVAPDPLKAYLSPRMLITLVVLSYSLYPLVTSGLLYTLQCVYIPGPFAAESAAVEYSRGHYDWLLQRQAAANRTAVPAAVAMSSAFGRTGQSDIQLCRPGQGALEAGLCWVTGRFWAMDYDVQVGLVEEYTAQQCTDPTEHKSCCKVDVVCVAGHHDVPRLPLYLCALPAAHTAAFCSPKRPQGRR